MRQRYAILLFVALWAPPSHAQLIPAAPLVNCVNCNTLVQQLLDYAKQLEQLTQEIQTAQNTLNFYINAVQNTVQLPSTVYRDLTSDISRLAGVAGNANMFGGFTGTMINNLASKTGYPIGNIGRWDQQLVRESNAISNAMATAAQVINMFTTESQAGADSTSLAALQTEAVGDDGRLKVLQTLGGVLAQLGQQTIKSQGTLAATMQAMATFQTARADRDAMLIAVNAADISGALKADCITLAAGGGSSWVCSNYGVGAPGATNGTTLTAGGGPTTFLIPGTDTPVNAGASSTASLTAAATP